MATINSSAPAIKKAKPARSTGMLITIRTLNETDTVSGFNPDNVTEGTFKEGEKPSDALGIWGRTTHK